MIDTANIPNPCFVIEEAKIKRNIKVFERLQAETNVKFLMALKGFANYKAFDYFKGVINGASASSYSEAKLAYDYLSQDVHLYAPVYLEDELEEMAKFSTHITFNSYNQYERFYNTVKQINPAISVGLRVNPGYSDVETELYNPANPQSRLGIPAESFDKLPEGVEGLHFHTLCESKDDALEKLIDSFEEKFGKYLNGLKWINIGGGHLVTHKDYNLNRFVEIMNEFSGKYPHLTVYAEPSAAYVWQTGFLLARIEDVVENGGMKTAILNVSFTAHMPDTLEMPYKPRVLNETENGKYVYRFGGNSCLAGDFIDGFRFDKPLKTGDEIILCDMVHYTTVKTTFFNGVKHPSIGLLRENGEFTLFKSFSYEDYKNKL